MRSGADPQPMDVDVHTRRQTDTHRDISITFTQIFQAAPLSLTLPHVSLRLRGRVASPKENGMWTSDDTAYAATYALALAMVGVGGAGGAGTGVAPVWWFVMALAALAVLPVVAEEAIT